MYIARNHNGTLVGFSNEPIFDNAKKCWHDDKKFAGILLDSMLFPNLDYTDTPIKVDFVPVSDAYVKLTLKPKFYKTLARTEDIEKASRLCENFAGRYFMIDKEASWSRSTEYVKLYDDIREFTDRVVVSSNRIYCTHGTDCISGLDEESRYEFTCRKNSNFTLWCTHGRMAYDTHYSKWHEITKKEFEQYACKCARDYFMNEFGIDKIGAYK